MKLKSVLQESGIFTSLLFSRAACERHIADLSSNTLWEEAKVTSIAHPIEGEVRQEYRSARFLGMKSIDVVANKLEALIALKLLPKVNRHYNLQLEQIGEFGLVHYPVGGHFVAHIDNDGAYAHRRFSVVIYLNDVTEGGETWFPDLDLCIKPEAGRAIIFPSDYWHQAMPVVRGEKFVFVCWVWGPPPIKWI